jgi:hypothetical protein
MPTAKMECPLCQTSKFTTSMPRHIMTQHRSVIRLRKTQPNHCVYAYVIGADGEEASLCVCLTCKKGVMSDGTTGNGSRWITLHARNAECKAAHTDARAVFRQELDDVSAVVTCSTPCLLENLWREWKKDRRLRPMMEEVEDICKWMYEENPVFEPSEGMRQAIITAVGYKKAMELSKAELTKLAIEHDAELITQRDVISKQGRDISALEMVVRSQEREIAELRMRMTVLEKENDRNKKGFA